MSSDFAIEVTTTGGTDNRWLASSHGVTTIPGTANLTHLASAIDAYGYLPGGVGVAKITATGQYGLYTPGAVDGTEVLAGFTHDAVNTRTKLNVVQASGKAPIAVVKTATISRKFLPVVAQRTGIVYTTANTGQFVLTD